MTKRQRQQNTVIEVKDYHASHDNPRDISDAQELIEGRIAGQSWYSQLSRAERHVVHQQAAKLLKKLLGKRVIGKRRSTAGSPVTSYSVLG